jgi:transposase
MLAMKNTQNKIASPITMTQTSSHQEEVCVLREEVITLKSIVQSQAERIRWFEKQLFGSKSEKRIIDNPLQFNLLTEPTVTEIPLEEEQLTITYQRGTAKKNRPDDCVTDAGLRFSDDVPVEVIRITPPELEGDSANDYEIIDTKISRKLAQQPASYVILQYETPVFKCKKTQAVKTTAMPEQVLDNSIADVSLLVGLLVDKFLYHLPLYRQHLRMSLQGITVSRASLTNWVKRTIELLRPIVDAQLAHVLLSKVLAMDETPIKASRGEKGKMKTGYFWPIYGEDHEVVFTFNKSRGRLHVEDVLRENFKGTLITDGYSAYARFAEKSQGVTHAQCWVHSRRYFVDAEDVDKNAADCALYFIGRLYKIEEHIADKNLVDEKKRDYRLTHSKPIVDNFFVWCAQQIQRHELTPKHKLRKALNYVLTRENELRVFLEDPQVPMDTNHLEREIRPITLGRKNWLFCWTELGAEHVGLIQSLISTCKLHDINPNTYLTDVLQRISIHPASQVADLTPRLWKEKFATNPLRSVLQCKTEN